MQLWGFQLLSVADKLLLKVLTEDPAVFQQHT